MMMYIQYICIMHACVSMVNTHHHVTINFFFFSLALESGPTFWALKEGKISAVFLRGLVKRGLSVAHRLFVWDVDT